LAEKGAAVREDGEPARYTPVDPSVLVETARTRITDDLQALSSELASLGANSDSEPPVWIRGEDRVEARLRAALERVESEIVLIVSRAETGRIRGMIDRRVRLYSRESKHGFAILIDGKKALFGRLGPRAE